MALAVRFVLGLLLASSAVEARITARIGEAVPRQWCHTVIDNVQALITSTSQGLFEATQGRSSFPEIQIVLPPSWAGSKCVMAKRKELAQKSVDTRVFPSNFAPDFDISVPHPLFGGEPLARHFGSCGEPGNGVSVPYTLLSSNVTTYTAVRVFQEWLRSRLGVYSERGFPEDEKFPLKLPDLYTLDGEAEWNQGCQELEEMDTLKATDQQIFEGFSPLIPGVFCNKHTEYSRTVPTKQNLLCNGKSVWEMLLDSSEFRSAAPVAAASTSAKEEPQQNMVKRFRHRSLGGLNPLFEPPRFSLVLPAEPQRVILVLDVSQNMMLGAGAGGEPGTRRAWELIRDSLWRLVANLPLGSELGIITFDGAEARVTTPPTVVKASNRDGLYGRIPYRLSTDRREGCVSCGVSAGLDLVTDNEANTSTGVLVLITASECKLTSELNERLTATATPIFAVSLANREDQALAKATRFGGHFVLNTRKTTGKHLLQKISGILLDILGKAGGPKLVQSFEKYFVWNGKRITGTFRIDPNLNRDVWVVLTSAFKEDIESLEVTSPSGKRFAFPNYDHGVVDFHFPGPVEAGIWSYNFQLHHTVHNGAIVTLQVLGQQHKDSGTQYNGTSHSGIQVRTWTNVPVEGQKSPSEQPVAIYAEVLQDGLPVQDALVQVMVTRPDGELVDPFPLRDKGTGYPDITQRDGVYSGYLTSYSGQKGYYSYSVMVTDNEGKSQVHQAYAPGNARVECCGSAWPATGTPVPTRAFQRYLEGNSFYVQDGAQYFIRNGAEPEMKDVFPPARVTDLTVNGYVNGTLYASLGWTAPGGDLDQGRASRYEIRCFSNLEGISEDSYTQLGVPVHENFVPVPAPVGTEQSSRINLPWANEVFFYGLVTYDEEGNESPISNLVPVMAFEEMTTTSLLELSFTVVNETTSSAEGQSLLKSWRSLFFDKDVLVLVIGGGVAALVLMVVIVFGVAICRARCREKRATKRSYPHSRSLKELTISSPYLVQHHSGFSKTESFLDATPHPSARKDQVLTHSANSAFEVWKINSSNQDELAHLSILSNSNPNGTWSYQTLPGRATSGHVSLPPNLVSQSTLGLTQVGTTDYVSSEVDSSNPSHSPTYSHWAPPASASSGPIPAPRGAAARPTATAKGSCDSGTTASTDCSDSDHNSDKNVYNVPSSTVTKDVLEQHTLGVPFPAPRRNNSSASSATPSTRKQNRSKSSSSKLSSSSMRSAASLSTIELKKKRQESLV